MSGVAMITSVSSQPSLIFCTYSGPTMDVAKAVKEVKAGKIEFRVDKTGNLHAPIGKRSFSAEQLYDNLAAFLDAVMRARPAAAKGSYIKTATVSSTMGPGARIDTAEYR